MTSRSPVAQEAVNASLIALGVLSAGMGLNGFLMSSHFIDGGVTGVSMLLADLTPWKLTFWLPVVNLPFIALGYRHIGKAFAVRSVLAIAGLSAALAFVPYPDVTPDRVLTAVFGGFFLGAGIGLAVRGNAVLDGTEVLALIIARRTHVLRVGDVILAFNIVLFLIAMTVLGVEPALYSILTYLAAAKTVDFVLYGLEEHTAVTIVTRRSRETREAILRELGRGVTVYKTQGGMSGQEQEALYCVVTRLEIGRVLAIARSHDPSPFIVYHPLAHVEGGVKKRGVLDA